jgi:hypothetical protein
MNEGQKVKVDLGDSGTLVVLAEPFGTQLVAHEEITARLAAVTDPIQRVAEETLNALKRAKPTKAVVELGFGMAVQEGQLVALLGKGKAEATITVTLEWSERENAG